MKTKSLLFIILFLLIVLSILITKIYLNNNSFKFYETFSVPVGIGTEKFLLLLDTGASDTVLDTQLAKKFSVTLDENNKYEYNDALNSITSDTLIKPISLKLGNHNIVPNTLISHDFAELRKMSGENIQGIIGLDIIRRFIWSIDLNKHQITMGRNIKYNGNQQQCTKLQDDGYGLFMQTIYSKNKKTENVYFQLDTGFSSNRMDQEVANYLRVNKSVVENTLNKENPNIGITMKNKVSINDAISYINNMYLPVNVTKGKEHLEPIILLDIDVFKNAPNLLGKKFIEQFNEVVINPYDKTFCFIKNPQVKVLKTIRQIYTKHNNNRIIIDYNNAKYLDKFLLNNKDIIVSINGKKYNVDDLGKVRHLLRYEHNLNLEIRRNNKIINIKLN